MTVTSVSAGGPSSSASSSPAPSNDLGKDDFLRLLLTQMGQQDPTAPRDAEDFVAQLAQFAALEAGQATNERLEALLVAEASSAQLAAAQLVGKEVAVATDQVAVRAGQAEERTLRAAEDAQSITVVITDEAGREVRRDVVPGPFEGGAAAYRWDAIGSTGAPVVDGAYSIRVTAVNAEGKPASVTAQKRGLVDAVSYQNGYAELLVGGEVVSMADVVEVRAPSDATWSLASRLQLARFTTP